MTTLIKKDQIAVAEFIKNPQPSDPWNSTTDTASLAAIAAKIAESGRCNVYYGECDENYYGDIEVYLSDENFAEDLPPFALLMVKFRCDIPAAGTMSVNSSQGYFVMDVYHRASAIAAGDILSGDTCMLLYDTGDVYLLCNDRWSLDIAAKQDALESGVSIKTINGNSVVGSGDLSLPGKIFCGVTYTASSETAKAVELTTPSGATFADGDFLLLRFTNAVAASVTGTTITIGTKTYGIAYRNYGLQAADVIKAGDNVLLYCNGYFAHIVAIDRWGADLSSLSFEPQFTHYSHTISSNGGTLTLSCASDEKSYHVIVVSPGLTTPPTLVLNLQNNHENQVVLLQTDRDITNFPLTLQVNGTDTDNVVTSSTSGPPAVYKSNGQKYIYTKGLLSRLTFHAVPGGPVVVYGELLDPMQVQ